MYMLSTTLRRTALPLGAVTLVLSAAACSTQAQSAPPAPEPPHVKTVAAVRRDVPLETVFTGRVEPIHSVELRARVGGALDTVLFREGARVSAGTPLFQIDQRPYAIALRRAEAEAATLDAQLARAREELQRAERLAAADAVSVEEARAAARRGRAC